jgi:hypothetical protein
VKKIDFTQLSEIACPFVALLGRRLSGKRAMEIPWPLMAAHGDYRVSNRAIVLHPMSAALKHLRTFQNLPKSQLSAWRERCADLLSNRDGVPPCGFFHNDGRIRYEAYRLTLVAQRVSLLQTPASAEELERRLTSGFDIRRGSVVGVRHLHVVEHGHVTAPFAEPDPEMHGYIENGDDEDAPADSGAAWCYTYELGVFMGCESVCVPPKNTNSSRHAKARWDTKAVVAPLTPQAIDALLTRGSLTAWVDPITVLGGSGAAIRVDPVEQLYATLAMFPIGPHFVNDAVDLFGTNDAAPPSTSPMESAGFAPAFDHHATAAAKPTSTRSVIQELRYKQQLLELNAQIGVASHLAAAGGSLLAGGSAVNPVLHSMHGESKQDAKAVVSERTDAVEMRALLRDHNIHVRPARGVGGKGGDGSEHQRLTDARRCAPADSGSAGKRHDHPGRRQHSGHGGDETAEEEVIGRRGGYVLRTF